MVGRLFTLLTKEIGSLHEAAFLLAAAAFLSQLLALVRDRLLASTFGAGSELDIYYSAFRLPDLIYVSVASFISVTVLIPFMVEKLGQGDKEAVRRLLNQLFTLFFLVMAVASAVAWIFLPRLAPLIAPGFNPGQLAQLVILSRIMLLSPFLLGLSNLAGSITQGLHKFFIYAASPLFYNLGIILGLFWFYPSVGLPGLAAGVVLGALLHLAVQLPVLVKARLVPHFSTISDWSQIKEIIVISLPRTITLGVHQLSLLVLIALASTFSAGAVAVFNLAWNLQSVPLAIVGVSYSVAAFPTLAKLFAQGERDAFLSQIRTAARHIIFWSLVATVFFVVLRAQVVRVILGAGEFGWTETRLTAAALAIFAVSVVAQSLVLLFVRGYYAAGRTRVPFWLNTGSSLLVIILAYFFHRLSESWVLGRYFIESLLRVSDLEGTAMLSLPLAFSVGLLINLGLFLICFYRDFGGLGRSVSRAARQAAVAAISGGFISYQLLNWLALRFDLNTFNGIFAQGFLAGLGGLVTTFTLLVAISNTEVKELLTTLRRKFWQTHPIAPEPEEL